MLKFLSYKGRSVWKSFYVGNQQNTNNEMMLRNQIIQKKDIDKMYSVHTGKNYQLIRIDEKMKGLKAGQFVLTKKMGMNIHVIKNKKKRKK